MKYYLILLILTINSAMAKTLYLPSSKKSVPIEILTKDNVKINSLCLKLDKKCKALMATKLKINKVKHQDGSHPASVGCEQKGGESIILQDDKRNDYDFCLFKDGSMIDSWDLEKSY